MTEKEREVIQGAAQVWDRWQEMQNTQDYILKSGDLLPSYPRDSFESYLDWLTTEAKTLLLTERL